MRFCSRLRMACALLARIALSGERCFVATGEGLLPHHQEPHHQELVQ